MKFPPNTTSEKLTSKLLQSLTPKILFVSLSSSYSKCQDFTVTARSLTAKTEPRVNESYWDKITNSIRSEEHVWRNERGHEMHHRGPDYNDPLTDTE